MTRNSGRKCQKVKMHLKGWSNEPVHFPISCKVLWLREKNKQKKIKSNKIKPCFGWIRGHCRFSPSWVHPTDNQDKNYSSQDTTVVSIAFDLIFSSTLFVIMAQIGDLTICDEYQTDKKYSILFKNKINQNKKHPDTSESSTLHEKYLVWDPSSYLFHFFLIFVFLFFCPNQTIQPHLPSPSLSGAWNARIGQRERKINSQQYGNKKILQDSKTVRGINPITE